MVGALEAVHNVGGVLLFLMHSWHRQVLWLLRLKLPLLCCDSLYSIASKAKYHLILKNMGDSSKFYYIIHRKVN